MRRRNVGCRARRRLPSPSDMIRDPFLKTEGIHNFRDYGGYPAAGGGRVKTGLLFRSGQHCDASESDLAAIEALDIRTIIDLRGQSERESFPCRRHEDFGAHVIAYEGETTSTPPHEAGGGAVGGAGMSAEGHARGRGAGGAEARGGG